MTGRSKPGGRSSSVIRAGGGFRSAGPGSKADSWQFQIWGIFYGHADLIIGTHLSYSCEIGHDAQRFGCWAVHPTAGRRRRVRLRFWAYQRKGQFDIAIEKCQRASQSKAALPCGDFWRTYAVTGRRNEPRAIVNELASNHGGTTAGALAVACLGLGETGEVFRWLELALSNRDEWMIWIHWDSRADPLRADPRFADLLRPVGLTPRAPAGRQQNLPAARKTGGQKSSRHPHLEETGGLPGSPLI